MSEELVEFCDDCGKEFPLEQMTEKGAGFFCEDCFVPTCMECDEPIDDDVDFCSHDCYKQYWADIMEDEYKNRD